MSGVTNLKSGIFWMTVFSVIAIFIGFLRNYILSDNFAKTDVLGSYALVMLFFNAIMTFGLFGGSSLVSTLIPKEINFKKKIEIFYNNIYISLILSIFIFGLIYLNPSVLSIVFSDKIDFFIYKRSIVLIPIVIISQMCIFWLQGNLNFKTSSFLSQCQIFAFTLVIMLSYLNDSFKELIIRNPYLFFVYLILIINVLIIIFVFKTEKLPFVSINKLNFPKLNFFRLGFNLYLGTILTFIYLYYDQIMITKFIGLKELGFYFLILQLVDLIRFIPQRLGQIFLASFARMIGDDDRISFQNIYKKSSENLLLLNLIISIGLIVSSKLLFNIFNIDYSKYGIIFMLLILVRNISGLGVINSMIILSKEKSRLFLYNSFLLICFQTLIIYFTIEAYGILSVVIAQLVSTITGQLGLWLIIKRNFAEINISKLFFANIILVLISIYSLEHKIVTHFFIQFSVLLIAFFLYKNQIQFLSKKVMFK